MDVFSAEKTNRRLHVNATTGSRITRHRFGLKIDSDIL